MSETSTAAVVLAAGLGTRMRSAVPKHLHTLLGRRMVDWVIAAAASAGADRVVVVSSPDSRRAFEGFEVAVQEKPLGTGDAARAAHGALHDFEGDVLLLSGDVPGLTEETLRSLLETHRAEHASATVLSFEPPDTRSYGRIVRDAGGRLARIVEARDASPDELALTEVNSGIYVFKAEKLWPVLERLEPKNAQGELYVTDTLGFLVADGEPVAVHVAADPFEVEGINTRDELAANAAVLRDRINKAHMLAGVTIVDPATTWIDPDVLIEPDVTVHPFVVLRGSTKIATGAEIHSQSVIVDAEVGPGAMVGPFCYLRPGTVLAAESKAGSFVEIKNSRIGTGAKVPHLSYIGDAEVGEGSNVGAGAITANFPHRPGQPKGRTKIGKNVRTGIQNGFIAPVEVGDGAWTAAGTTVTKDVPADALAIARTRQENKEGYAARHRDD
ncbi:MAG TPA: bifunctional UDP-N-acetylglucosamine diphosphorylase/glucosamine-1-phosphate N-acetyltransferase GlmU [Gaiellaceae bacterium]|nr:bifunctional UDP-N-acetylglucosamine diphosphorylase/glucosamine-1-phosphate N-acetyltransferase GlmU [Gaiellaceae bacterium]